MQTNPSSPWQTIPTIVVIFLLLALIGSFPIGLIGTLFFGETIGSDLSLIAAVIIATWLPLKLAVDRYVKEIDTSKLMALVPRLSLSSIIITSIIIIILVPVLWSLTGIAFVAGLVAYTVLGQSLAAGLLVGLGTQLAMIYRASQREKASGLNSNLFTRFGDMQDAFNVQTVTISADDLQRQSDDIDIRRPDEPQVRYLDAGQDDASPHRRDTISDDDDVIVVEPDEIEYIDDDDHSEKNTQ
jgi:hypothetical protein